MRAAISWWNDIEVVDIVDDPRELDRLFRLASKDTHRNSGNYDNLQKRYDGYLAFHAIYKQGNPVAFSGVYEHSMWKDCVRIADRSYYFPEYRVKSLKRLPDIQSIYRQKIDAVSRIFIPLHLDIARENDKIPFITIQERHRRRAMVALLSHVNELHDIKMVMLDGMRYVGTSDFRVKSDALWHSVGCLKKHKKIVGDCLEYIQRYELESR